MNKKIVEILQDQDDHELDAVIDENKADLKSAITRLEGYVGKLERFIDVTVPMKEVLDEISQILTNLDNLGVGPISARDYIDYHLRRKQ